MSFSNMEDALEDIAKGRFVVVVDDENRENEGDLIMAAERTTPEAMAFLIRHTSGVVCVAMAESQLDRLDIPMMVDQNSDRHGTAFTVSVDLALGTSTGISAADRSATVRALVAKESGPQNFRRPGHIFPLRARPGGVIERPGHTEAACDLARLAGLQPAGVLCELVNDDGTMKRGAQLLAFAEQYGFRVLSIQQIIDYRKNTEASLRQLAKTRLPTKYGDFFAYVFQTEKTGLEHIAFVMGDVKGEDNVLVRVHSECMTGDLIASLRCDCGDQMTLALERIGEEKRGILVYLRGHEGRGIGLSNKLRAYELQDRGLDTVDANLALSLPIDSRDFGDAAKILARLGVKSVRLLSNNPDKASMLTAEGTKIAAVLPLVSGAHVQNVNYLQTKQRRMGHRLGLSETSNQSVQLHERWRQQA